MLNKLTYRRTIPSLKSFKAKFALVALLVTFLLDYQPAFTFPPITQPTVQAEAPTIEANTLPFTFQLPHPGYLSTPFSSYHPGVDIATGLGMPIKPVAEGTVVSAGYSFWGLGLNVVIDHGSGYKSLYAHLGKTYVKPDQKVTAQTTLGEVGLTGHTSGPHTHLEITKDSQYVDPKLLLPEMRTNPLAEDFLYRGGRN